MTHRWTNKLDLLSVGRVAGQLRGLGASIVARVCVTDALDGGQ